MNNHLFDNTKLTFGTKKELSYRWILLLISIVILSSVMIISHNLLVSIIAFFIFTIVLISLVDFDILHPFTWFSPFFTLYSVSYPFLVYTGEKPELGYTMQTLLLEWIAFITFAIVIGPRKIRLKKFKKQPLVNTTTIIRVLIFITFFMTFLYIIYIYSNGYTSKYEISSSGSFFIKFGAFFTIFTLLSALYISNRIILMKKLPWRMIILTTLWMVISFLVSGERDFIYRHIWIIIFLIDSIYKEIPKKALVLTGVVGIISVPILGGFKNFLIANKNYNSSDSPLISQIFSGEFISASRNLQILMVNAHSWDFFEGKTLWWDFKRTFIPEFLTLSGTINPVSWFNNVFYLGLVNRGGGQGFSLVGEGYMNFGSVGVILWFVLFSMIIKFMYQNSNRNILFLNAYIILMPTAVYTIRADLSNLLSPLFSQVTIPIFLIILAKIILIRK